MDYTISLCIALLTLRTVWSLSTCIQMQKYLFSVNSVPSSVSFILMLTRSRLGLLHINFRKYTKQLWPLVIVKFLFSHNIFWTNWWNLTKFCICIDNMKIIYPAPPPVPCLFFAGGGGVGGGEEAGGGGRVRGYTIFTLSVSLFNFGLCAGNKSYK